MVVPAPARRQDGTQILYRRAGGHGELGPRGLRDGCLRRAQYARANTASVVAVPPQTTQRPSVPLWSKGMQRMVTPRSRAFSSQAAPPQNFAITKPGCSDAAAFSSVSAK